MIRIYLLFFLIATGYALIRKFLSLSPLKRQQYFKTLGIASLLIVLVLLGVTGHLNWVLALMGVVITFLLRSLPILMRYAPQLHQLWRSFKKTASTDSESDNVNAETFTNSRGAKNSGMTVTQAYKILGLSSEATKQDVIQAHKKLMQKMHPDRGGSDYLASQINLAKDLLLKVLK